MLDVKTEYTAVAERRFFVLFDKTIFRDLQVHI